MRRSSFVALALLSAAFLSCASIYDNFIVGGTGDNNDSLQAWTVTFVSDASCNPANFICTGTAINSNWVLTAAHCQRNGTLNLSSMATTGNDTEHCTQTLPITSITPYPCFGDGAPNNYDIALVQLGGTVTGALPPIQTGGASTPTVTFAGRGRQSTSPPPDGRLYSVTMALQTNDTCVAAWGSNAFTNIMQCAGDKAKYQGVGKGDSGGPVLVGSSSAGWSLVGVTSYGGPGTTGWYSVYNEITPDINDWINGTMAGTPPTVDCK